MVNGRSSPVPSFRGHSEPKLPTVGLRGPGDGRTHWSVQLWVGVFPPNNGAHLCIFHNRYECDRRHGVCERVCVSLPLRLQSESQQLTEEEEKEPMENREVVRNLRRCTRPLVLWTGKGLQNVLNTLASSSSLSVWGFFHEYCITSLKCLWCRTLFFSRNSSWTSVAWTIQHVIHSASSNSPRFSPNKCFLFLLNISCDYY